MNQRWKISRNYSTIIFTVLIIARTCTYAFPRKSVAPPPTTVRHFGRTLSDVISVQGSRCSVTTLWRCSDPLYNDDDNLFSTPFHYLSFPLIHVIGARTWPDTTRQNVYHRYFCVHAQEEKKRCLTRERAASGFQSMPSVDESSCKCAYVYARRVFE